MDDKYAELIKTLPEDSQELWFEYNLAVNRILQENANLQERVDKLQQENKSQKEIIDKAINFINTPWSFESGNKEVDEIEHQKKIELIKLLEDKEVLE